MASSGNRMFQNKVIVGRNASVQWQNFTAVFFCVTLYVLKERKKHSNGVGGATGGRGVGNAPAVSTQLTLPYLPHCTNS